MSDEVVGRVRYALDKQRSWRGTEWQDAPRASLPTADLRTLLAALARVTEENGALRGALKADAERLSAAEVKVFGESVHGCDAADWIADAALAARRDAGAFRVAVSLALGPCAPEHEGTPVVEAIQRMREERDAANAHIALLEGEGHTGCDERIYQAEQEVEALTRDLATLRAENARLREGLQTIATLTINFNNHSAVMMARFASNVLAGRKHFDDGAALTGGPHE